MLTNKDLVQLAVASVKAARSKDGSYKYSGIQMDAEKIQKAFFNAFVEKFGSKELYRQNHNDFYALIEQTLDILQPEDLMSSYSNFAEIRQFGNADKPEFVIDQSLASIKRGRTFCVRGTEAGTYEAFKLMSNERLETEVMTYTDAVVIGYEEMLDNRADITLLLRVLNEGFDLALFTEIRRQMGTLASQLGTYNKKAATGFNEAAFDALIRTVGAYSNVRPSIYCDEAFAVKILPANIAMMSDAMKDTLWNSGRFASYKGCPVNILPNDFVDNTNATWQMERGLVYIVNGSMPKPVKIALIGETQTREDTNRSDWSHKIDVYRKLGVAMIVQNDMGLYKDLSLFDDYSNDATNPWQ